MSNTLDLVNVLLTLLRSSEQTREARAKELEVFLDRFASGSEKCTDAQCEILVHLLKDLLDMEYNVADQLG